MEKLSRTLQTERNSLKDQLKQFVTGKPVVEQVTHDQVTDEAPKEENKQVEQTDVACNAENVTEDKEKASSPNETAETNAQ